MAKYLIVMILSFISFNSWASTQVADYFFHFLTVALIISTTAAVLKVRSMPKLDTKLLKFIGFGVTFWLVMFTLLVGFALVYQFTK